MTENEIGTRLVEHAIHIHRTLGPGLLESVYEAILARRLDGDGLGVVRQAPLPIEFEGQRFDEGFRADLVIDGKVIVELKSVESANPAHKKQLLTYLKLSNLKLGYLINFGEPVVSRGITRIINGTIDE